MTSTDALALSSLIASLAAVAAVFANVRMVKQTLKAQQMEYVRNHKVRAYSELMYSFEEVCDAQTSNDAQRKTIAETAMNRAIAMIDLIGPETVYASVTLAHNYVDRPRDDAERNIHLDNMYSVLRRDIEVTGDYRQAYFQRADEAT